MPHKTKATISGEQMVELRREGATLEAIAVRAGLCSTRVGQIIRERAPDLGKRMKRKKTNKEFTGTDLDVAVKEALRGYVKRTDYSISAFIAEAVEEKLIALGVVIERTPVNRGEPLPFGDPA